MDAPDAPADRDAPVVEVQRSRRRKRTATAYWREDTIVVVLPHRVDAAQAEQLTTNLVSRLLARAARERATDTGDLMARADRLTRTYLEPRLGYPPLPTSVTWVTNQNTRWGSCTMPDRTIRLSHRLQSMPDWVVDYVLLHELAHLVQHDHSAAFWRLLRGYPRVERARGYLDGWTDATRDRRTSGHRAE